jgi:hypothetical protein
MRLRERYRRLTLWNKIAFWGSVASVLSLAALFIPSRQQPPVLSIANKKTFVQNLSSCPRPREDVRLSCPGADEQACVLAGEFLELFQAAQWKVVGDQVLRGQIGKPRRGIVLLKRGVTTSPPPPGSGVWVNMSPSLTALQRAFAGIGQHVETFADAAQPEGVITVFVGPR